MARPHLERLVPDATADVLALLAPDRGPLDAPIRSEVFGRERFAQHGRSLGETHRVKAGRSGVRFFPRLSDNVRVLHEVHRFIGSQVATGHDVNPAAEWFLDNFHVVSGQEQQIHDGLTRSELRRLPLLADEPLAGLLRIYGVAWAFVAHTDGAFDEAVLLDFLTAYQETRELSLGELSALPTIFRVILVENLRRLAERMAANQAARALANLCCDRIDSLTPDSLDVIRVLLQQRGVGRVFLAQMAQRLIDQRAPKLAPYHEWLDQALPDLTEVQRLQPGEQAADNQSVSNAIVSLRLIGNAGWGEIAGRTSATMRLLLTSSAFEAESDDTRDQTLAEVKRLSRRSGRSEFEVAQAVLRLTQPEGAPAVAGDEVRTPRDCLFGAGRAALLCVLDPDDRWTRAWSRLAPRAALPAYLATLALGTAGLVAWMLMRYGVTLSGAVQPWLRPLAVALMLFPAAEAVLAIVNRLIDESVRPRRLPRLALADGIPADHRVMVAIPGVLTSAAVVDELLHRLELDYLANPEQHAQFALLTEWAEVATDPGADDQALLDHAARRITTLNATYPAALHGPPRFIVLHSVRRPGQTKPGPSGRGREHGTLEQLVIALGEGTLDAFTDLGNASRAALDTRYVVALDGATQLPAGRLRELVCVAAHPENQPRLDMPGRRVISGYGILQPRVLTPLLSPQDETIYHWIFSDGRDIDPDGAVTTGAFQKVFGEVSFGGQGLLNVGGVHAMLSERLPGDRSRGRRKAWIARCAAVTDMIVIEEPILHADEAASRMRAKIRRDWQLLPSLLLPARDGIGAMKRWKLLDDLRRSLVAPMSLGLIVLTLATGVLSPGAAVLLVLAAYCGGPLMAAITALAPSHGNIVKRRFYRQALTDFGRTFASGLWWLAQLLPNAMMAAEAVTGALWGTLVRHQHTPVWAAPAAERPAPSDDLTAILRRQWQVPGVAAALLGALWLAGDGSRGWGIALCLAWGAAPAWTWWVNRPLQARRDKSLPLPGQAYLEGVARDTWRFFERCVGPADSHLPPDNLQLTPHTLVAHRTTPTHIGLYLLSAACARQFGWIGTQDLLVRLEATLATLDTLPRYRGHFFNGYDTHSRAALPPMYVSTVDSGNLSGHLLAVAQACIELAQAPFDAAATHRALAASAQRLDALRDVKQALIPQGALAQLLDLADPLREAQTAPDIFDALLRDAGDQLDDLLSTGDALIDDSPTDEFMLLAANHLTTLRSALLDENQALSGAPGEGWARRRLLTVVACCERLAWEPDFTFLLHRKRNLLHIGFNVADHQLDTSFHDLLASESRLSSLLAIAKGDVPVTQWTALGRPFYAVGPYAGLRSWSGSMVEYLLPALVLDEPAGSVLSDACHAALIEQIDYGRQRKVPWGISESCYAAIDEALAYQYAPQGVPRLALRRMPVDKLVVAPYATALAAQIAPADAVANLSRLERSRLRGRYGFIEAADYSAAHQSQGMNFSRVDTFKAHHQGMSIVALANVLLDRAPRRWGMGHPRIQAIESLLHERAPREVSLLLAPVLGPVATARPKRGLGLVREVVPGASAVEPTHLLSNGRYSVSLRANGAGWSRWGQVGIGRWHDDAPHDAHGSFIHLRWDGQPRAVSVTQHPAPDPEATYRSTFHADRVSFEAAWREIDSRVTVWVSAEDDLEFRQIELRNLTDRSIELELMSSFEPTLVHPGIDARHPAFFNIFLRAEWQPANQALVFERRSLVPNEPGLFAAHFISDSDVPPGEPVQVQTDRLRWRGRNQDASQPQASFDTPAAPLDGAASVPLETGVDPLCALAHRIRLDPKSKVRLTFCTAVSDDRDTLHALIDKYRYGSPVERASGLSATLAGIRLRQLDLNAETFFAIQTLTTALLMSITRQPRREAMPALTEVCDRRLLARLGVSGDRPIVTVTAGAEHGLGLLRSLAKALRMWDYAGVPCDLVVLNAEPTSGVMPLQLELEALRDRFDNDIKALKGATPVTGLHVLRLNDVSADEQSTLRAMARVQLNADGRSLAHHVQEWSDLHHQDREERQANSVRALSVIPVPGSEPRVSEGRFGTGGDSFVFEVNALQRPQRPWVNVIANSGFGTLVTDAGGGCTWALDSRQNQLTPWSNDPVSDPPGEWLLLQDLRTRQAWSVAPSAWGDPNATYQVVHGQGYSTTRHRRGDIEVHVSWCVDSIASVKQVRLRLVNRGPLTHRLRVVGIVDWLLGAARGDRDTLATSPMSQPRSAAEATSADLPAATRRLTGLLATQRDRSAPFAGGTGFFGMLHPVDDADGALDWTCDRRECFDALGQVALPDRFGRRSGVGLDPCAALSSSLSLEAGESTERVFLLGFGITPDAALRVAAAAATVPPQERIDQARKTWDELLGATTVATPDPLFDAMVNRWLLYQTVSCRLWARIGFYQAVGACGFREQLQDSMALAWTAPTMLRQHILLCASRQYAEGDVQHRWHEHTGVGVRTRSSDDLLWLPHAIAHYLHQTGDSSVMDEAVPFLEGAAIPEAADGVYDVLSVSRQAATVYEHAARTIDRSLRVGAHGLPLIGTGDCNDAMDRVGAEGRGESVWLAWFLCDVVAAFAPLAAARGDADRAQRWRDARRGWQAALQGPGWDGNWFRRAFFDNGTPLGSSANGECRIELIAQAWSVLSGAAPNHLQQAALASMETHLVDADAGLIKLLTPPFTEALPSPGYMQAYPKGMRENGGQSMHAGVWALMARARVGDGDAAYRYFTYLSPAHRAQRPKHGAAYALEPYAMAGDVCTEGPYVGRGGWSWFTGSAAWMHRAAVESMLGVQHDRDGFSVVPCLPSHWPRAELTLRRGTRSVHVCLTRSADESGTPLAIGQHIRWNEGTQTRAFVVRLMPATEPSSGVRERTASS